MNLPGHTAPQAPHVLIRSESGAHAHGAAGHSATTIPGGRRRRTNDDAGARTTTVVPDNIPARFAPVAPVAPEPPSAPSAPSAPAGHRRTDGRAAWDGRSVAAATPQGGRTTARIYAPRGGSFINPTTTPPWPVASHNGPSGPLNVPQETYQPHYQADAQGNTTNPTLASGPSHHPGVAPARVFLPSNRNIRRPPAPSFNGAGGQLAYRSGPTGAPSSQYHAQIPTSLDALDQTHQTPLSFAPAVTPPLAVPSQTWEHYNATMNSPLPLILLPCSCPPRLINGAVPKDCSKAADHLLAWWHEYNKDQSNQFRIAVANTYVPPNATSQSYERVASQDAAARGPTSPSRETGVPQQRPDTLEAQFSAPSTTATPSRTTHTPFTSLPTHQTSPPTQDIYEPSDVAPQHLDPFVSHPAPSGGDPYSVPVVQVVTINPSDTVGPSSPSRAPPRGGGTHTNRRKASLNAVNPPAKRSRRVPQSNTTGTTEPQVVSTDESLGFESLDDQPEVQKAMRALVAAIRASQSFINKHLEPNLGTLEAGALMAVAPDGLWRGYGTKAKSIYSLFIKVDGKECICLWCGDVQKDKLQRAVGHFRAKHLGHEPFLCDDIHAGNEVCNVRFASFEAMGEHKRRKDKVKVNGKLRCDGCGRLYISVSNRNRHFEKCEGGQADPKHDDDEY